MDRDIAFIRHPELIFGIAGPIGIKIDELCESLSKALNSVQYKSSLIKITDEIRNAKSSIKTRNSGSFFEQMKFKMDHASALCREAKDPSLLMRYAIKGIRRCRSESEQEPLPLDVFLPVDSATIEGAEGDDFETVRISQAYIIRQIKRPEEIRLLRTVYGRQFILLSAYGTETQRKGIIEEKIRQSLPISVKSTEISHQAEELLHRDMHEGDDVFGQQAVLVARFLFGGFKRG